MKHERGNILFLILLAIILFAALTYAVTSGMRGGGKDASPEKYRSMAAQMVQFGSLVENAVTRARTVGGYPEWGLNFDDGGSAPSTSGVNNTCTESGCRIFNAPVAMGQINSLKFSEEFIDPRYRAASPGYGGGSGTETRFYILNVNHVGTDLPDVVMVIPGLKPELCRAINELLWSSATNADIFYPVSPANYTGTMTSLPSSSSVIFNNFYNGKAAACGGRENGGPYGGDFYQVILAR